MAGCVFSIHDVRTLRVSSAVHVYVGTKCPVHLLYLCIFMLLFIYLCKDMRKVDRWMIKTGNVAQSEKLDSSVSVVVIVHLHFTITTRGTYGIWYMCVCVF